MSRLHLLQRHQDLLDRRSLRFQSDALEQHFKQFYREKTYWQFKHACILGSMMFMGFGAFDFVFIGDFAYDADVRDALLTRAATAAILITMFLLPKEIYLKHQDKLCALSWLAAVVAMMAIIHQTSGGAALLYFLSLPLISVASSIFIPFRFSRMVCIKPIILAPLLAYYVFNNASMEIMLYQSAVLLSLEVMGIHAKYHSEITLRENFLQAEDIRSALDEARRANGAKDNFLAMVSHEIRTPLNGILGNARLIGLEDDLNGARSRASTIERSGEFLRKLIDDILDITRIEAGRLVLRAGTIGLTGFLREIEEQLRPIVADKDVELRFNSSAVEGRAVEGDESRIRQIVFNVVGNALKFTDRGIVEVVCDLAPASDGRQILSLVVRDTGIGIPRDDLQRVFEPLVQAANSPRHVHGGTGLGLSIVRRLVASMDGAIDLRSEVGEGTTVTITLPVDPARADAGRPVAAAGAKAGADGGLSVLVIEDDPVSREVVTSLLRIVGHSVTTADYGGSGIELYRGGRFDLVLVDFRLPDMTGVQVLEALSSTHAGRPIAAVAFTANVMQDDIETYKRAGFMDVIEKPVRPDALQNLRRYVHLPLAERSNIARIADRRSRMIGLLGAEEFSRIDAIFMNDLRSSVEDLNQAYSAGEIDCVRRIGHRLKGAARNLGYDEIGMLFEELESNASPDTIARLQSASKSLTSCAA